MSNQDKLDEYAKALADNWRYSITFPIEELIKRAVEDTKYACGQAVEDLLEHQKPTGKWIKKTDARIAIDSAVPQMEGKG